MATRVKKQSANTKEVASSQTTTAKNTLTVDSTPKSAAKGQNVAGVVRRLGSTRSPSKRIIKRTAAALKAKSRQSRLKINPTAIAETLEQNGKKLPAETKKTLLKNGIKEIKTRRPRAKKIKKELPDEITQEETINEVKKETINEAQKETIIEVKKETLNEAKKATPKKRVRKPKVPDLIEIKKVKTEVKIEPPEVEQEESVSITAKLNDLISEAVGTTKKVKRSKPKKIKTQAITCASIETSVDSTIEDVMSDLSSLIKEGNINKELDDSMSESSKSDSFKPKKLSKKQRLDILKNEIKKENIENTFSKMNDSEKTVINMLDLNVKNLTPDSLVVKRRHSIEKIPLSSENNATESAPNLFNQLPRCISPRTSKRIPKIRQSIDSVAPSRSSPYSTRSETPTRLLRNGKNSKQAKGNLLQGLEGYRRRKRNTSDVLNMESASKVSEYDSDSSYSDLASLHGSEKETEVSKPEENLLTDDSSNLETKTEDKPPHIIKRSISFEEQESVPESKKQDDDLFDTNSNVCSNNVSENNMEQDDLEEDLPLSVSPSSKVPEKSLILNSMKQMFNVKTEPEISQEYEVSKFYGKAVKQEEANIKKEIKDKNKLIIDKKEKAESLIKDEKDSMENNKNKSDDLIYNREEIEDHRIDIEDDKEDIENKTNDIGGTKAEIEDNGKDINYGEEDIEKKTNHIFGNKEENKDKKTETAKKHEEIEDKKEELAEKKEESLPPLEGFDFEEELNQLVTPKESEQVVTINVFTPVNTDISSQNDVFLQDFASEEKEAEEQRSFENIVQECIESIEDSKTPEQNTPVSEVPQEIVIDDTVPVIENMVEALVNDENVEHLEPPQLERSVEHFSNTPEFIDYEKNEICDDNEKMDVDPLASEEQDTAEANEEQTALKEHLTEPECDNLPLASENLENSKPDQDDIKTSNFEPKIQVDSETKDIQPLIQESPEELQRKESMLSALGLQSKSAPLPRQSKRERQHKQNDDFYTGTLKTVIKINRDKKKGKSSLKMTLQKHKVKSEGAEQGLNEDVYTYITKEGPSTSTWKQVKEGLDSAGAHRKTHNSNRSNTEGSIEQTSDGESQTPPGETAAEKALLIPEKASSFSIHPGRLCKDECSYCFGKFGLFDTPCHIAQLKSVERQNKILETEKHLTRDSCLCDACYRHVDRKANTPSYTNKSFKRNSLVAPGPRQNHCHVLGCNNVSSNILRRKWIMKMRKSICQRINIDLDNPGLHSIPICDEHYTALEHLMICAMCKRHLAKNHIHYLGPEVKELNLVLNDEGIPIQLSDRPVVCKLCKCFTSVILKDPEERPDNSVAFFEEYKKRLLHFNDIVPMDAAEAEEPINIPGKNEKNQEKDLPKKKKRNHSGESKDSQEGENGEEGQNRAQNRTTSTDTNISQSRSQSRSESPEEDEYAGIDYNALIPAINMECPSDNENNRKEVPPQYHRKMVFGVQKKVSRLESMREAFEASKSLRAVRHHKPNDLAVQRLGQNPSISLRPAYPNYQDKETWEKCTNLGANTQISVRQLFPGEEELPLTGHVDFNNVKDKTPEGWEKCTSTIQYDEETKHLWQELQKPYGNQSSFLRHLILLEKYFRNGDLILSPNATHHAINYRESVMNRLRAYDNIPSNASQNIQPITMMPFNKMQRSQSGIITSFHTGPASSERMSNGGPGHSVTISQISNGTSGGSVSSKSTPITLQQLNSPPLLPTNTMLQSLSASQKAKSSGAPPGLISIQTGSTRPAINPIAMTSKPQPQSQKIKFPITKNWRPNLIPIDPTKKQERKTGLVQVISGGKPYHITLEDYKKMCAIKRSFEAKQKKMQEQQQKQLQQAVVVGQQSAAGGQLQAAGGAQQHPGSTVLVPQVQQHTSILKHIIPKKGTGLVISKSGGTVTETKPILPPAHVVSVTPSVTLTGIPPASNLAGIPVTATTSVGIPTSGIDQSETILEKLDRTVEKLGPADRQGPLHRIPKSLTVIPQTVRKSARPPSPILMITHTNSSGPNNSNKIQPANSGAPTNQS